MYFVGIDPGKKGCIVVLDSENPRKPQFHKMELMPSVKNQKTGKFRTRINPHAVRELFNEICVDLANAHFVLERLWGFGSEVAGCAEAGQWNFAADYGGLEWALVMKEIPHTLIEPQKWHEAVQRQKGKEKTYSVIRALQLFPQCHNDLKEGKYFDDNKAEALLLAYYGWKHCAP